MKYKWLFRKGFILSRSDPYLSENSWHHLNVRSRCSKARC